MRKIKQAREAAGLTQKQASEIIGVPLRTYQGWESAHRAPAPWVEELALRELANYKNTGRLIELDIDELIEWHYQSDDFKLGETWILALSPSGELEYFERCDWQAQYELSADPDTGWSETATAMRVSIEEIEPRMLVRVQSVLSPLS